MIHYYAYVNTPNIKHLHINVCRYTYILYEKKAYEILHSENTCCTENN